jgi:Na+/melibiose symporter-like transporter
MTHADNNVESTKDLAPFTKKYVINSTALPSSGLRNPPMTNKLNKLLLYTYGIADLGFVLIANMELYFFSAFLTDYAEFSLSITGYILGFTSLADIAFALVAGVILQKVTLTYGGKYRSWFLVGPPVVAALFILQFTKIGNTLSAAIIIGFGFVASHLIWNIVFTASASMVGRLGRSPDERTILSASRAQGMSAAGILFSVTSLPMIGLFTFLTNEITGFSLASAVYAFLMVLGYLYIYKMTSGMDPYDETIPDTGGNVPKQSVFEMVGLVFRNPPLLLLIVAEVFRNSYVLILSAFAIYYFKYVLDNLAFLTVFILAISISRLLGTFAATWIGVRIGKRHSYWIFLVLTAIVFALGKFFGGTTWSFTIIFCVGSLLGMVASSMSTALFSDTVVYGEWKTGKNIRAFTMALQTFPIKVGVLIRSGVLTFGLMAIGFVANTEPAPEVVEGIRSITSLTPAIACIISAGIFYFGYRIEDKRIMRMEEEISARKT